MTSDIGRSPQASQASDLPAPQPGTKRHYGGDGDHHSLAKRKRVKDDSANDHPSSPQKYLIIHQVKCSYHLNHAREGFYEDTPRLYAGESKETALHGKRPINLNPFDKYFADDNPDISFVVLKSYDCQNYYELVKDKFEAVPIPASVAKSLARFKAHFSLMTEDGAIPEPETEKILFSSRELRNAMEIIQATHPICFPSIEMTISLDAPYLCIYHATSIIEECISESTGKLSSLQQSHIRSLITYVQESHQEEFEEAKVDFTRGVVNVKHFSKLFGPNDTIVQRTSEGPVAYVVERAHFKEHAFQIECWTWEFDGIFYKSRHTWTVEWPTSTDNIPIASLALYPLKYDKTGMEDMLRKRGIKFWEFRTAVLVEYETETSVFELRATSNRYMIDLKTYGVMHPDNSQEHSSEDYGLEKSEAPPADSFLLLLPSTIRGYGFHDKKWSILSVDRTHAVSWSGDTFDRQLVLKAQKKELIKALVTVHTTPSRQQNSDIIDGKGKGLILLLHGGPGTGKTLTAESIAEFAERPLYRVTCGDIGTDPESVEKYLESVLYIGTLWGCVVLLDEADVFLEERTPTDLQRNALVSVFLRVLEYFEGILILTSNRVGTFDEAFKSRVQLAMHYPPLDEAGRWEIWNMFFRDMLDKDETLKYQGLRDKLDVLARHKLNGRQIRNVVNTARQLARYRKEDLAYMHVEQPLEVVNEFEQYVSDMRGYTDDEYAKTQGNRC